MVPDFWHESDHIQKLVAHTKEGGIEFHLTYADHDMDTGIFNIHIMQRQFTIDGSWQIEDVLKKIGFMSYPDCSISPDCYFKSYVLPKRHIDRENWFNNSAYQKYLWLVKYFPSLWQEIKEINTRLVGQGLMYPWRKDDFPIARFTPVPKSAWLNKYKSVEQSRLEEERDVRLTRIAELDKIMGVLYENGKPLEEAVEVLLRDLEEGVTPEMLDTIEENAPIDLKVVLNGTIATHPFVIEIMGSKSGVRKEDKKASDISSYLILHRQDEEKVMLLANTFRELDPADRVGKLHFSEQVKEPLEKQGVLLMTTVQLYEIWRGVKEDSLSLHEVVEQMYSQVGEFNIETGQE